MAERSSQNADRRDTRERTVTVVGAGTFVRGRVNGAGDLEIAGRIEGDVNVTGEVVVESTGLVAASIAARRIVVRGAVKGDLVAEESVLLESGARVVGDLRAPRIAIAPGGLARGHVQTAAAGAARPRSASASASRPREASSSTSKAAPAPAAAPAREPKLVVAAPAAAATAATAATARGASTGNGAKVVAARNGADSSPSTSRVAGRLGPPPPVVPALKKGTKAVAHHKKR
jgi:cytoskeletal protein CcmA (bactofilin family)